MSEAVLELRGLRRTYDGPDGPIHVLHGKKQGPILIVCSAMHGDEINGIAIIQKLLNLHLLKSLSGTLIAIPVLNIHGMIMNNRSLLDRRDLENSFPGSETGSFAARLAHVLT
ncbi:MAG: succinylglutamate desuccinylase/aspartoacylase family protein, partial [Alphaproteobacteria bacterium]|nr:succinylglutamate desuccinylase/aspartoacylase family protein [Alphaproteobacteria bacterium]